MIEYEGRVCVVLLTKIQIHHYILDHKENKTMRVCSRGPCNPEDRVKLSRWSDFNVLELRNSWMIKY